MIQLKIRSETARKILLAFEESETLQIYSAAHGWLSAKLHQDKSLFEKTHSILVNCE